jgi:hypothetical protein
LRPPALILNSLAAGECTRPRILTPSCGALPFHRSRPALAHFSIDDLVAELQGRIVVALERRNKKCKTFQSAPAKFFDVRHDPIIR